MEKLKSKWKSILYESFQKKFSKNPEFRIENAFSEDSPLYIAEIVNVQISVIECGKSKKMAKINALKLFMEKDYL
ncbi:MAG: hypothetical protein JJE53_02440 [Candidatus Pacebacteria bacterium]|nr:hypothetical protein [Candidatus Paceibacterota bacterium]